MRGPKPRSRWNPRKTKEMGKARRTRLPNVEREEQKDLDVSVKSSPEGPLWTLAKGGIVALGDTVMLLHGRRQSLGILQEPAATTGDRGQAPGQAGAGSLPAAEARIQQGAYSKPESWEWGEHDGKPWPRLPPG